MNIGSLSHLVRFAVNRRKVGASLAEVAWKLSLLYPRRKEDKLGEEENGDEERGVGREKDIRVPSRNRLESLSCQHDCVSKLLQIIT